MGGPVESLPEAHNGAALTTVWTRAYTKSIRPAIGYSTRALTALLGPCYLALPAGFAD